MLATRVEERTLALVPRHFRLAARRCKISISVTYLLLPVDPADPIRLGTVDDYH